MPLDRVLRGIRAGRMLRSMLMRKYVSQFRDRLAATRAFSPQFGRLRLPGLLLLALSLVAAFALLLVNSARAQSCPTCGSPSPGQAEACSQSEGTLVCDDGSFICEPGTSPIIIDTKGQGFHLTSVANGVVFSFSAYGPPVYTAWTDPAYANGFLALDRNGDGEINNGTDLFGNMTPQPPSDNPNGYLALAVFDQPAYGGNGNGVIDPGDTVFSQLRVWIDKNHNGISEPDELFTLNQVGISRIDLKYTESRYVDQYGNEFRYKGRIWDTAGIEHHSCYDVFFKTGGPAQQASVRSAVGYRAAYSCFRRPAAHATRAAVE